MRNLLVLLSLISSVMTVSANEISDLFTKVQTVPLEMEFELEIYWSIREKTESKDGSLLIHGNEEFNFVLDNTAWISDGVTVWQYSEKDNQVIIRNFFDLSTSMHPTTMFNRFSKYEFSKTNSDDGEIWQWKGDSDPEYLQIDIQLTSDNTAFKTIRLVDNDENESTYSFKSMAFVDAIDPSEFVFKIPDDGVEVFDER